jgi:8-oxo-dGTP pyrophosphatase MutT (NUDIX family)
VSAGENILTAVYVLFNALIVSRYSEYHNLQLVLRGRLTTVVFLIKTAITRIMPLLIIFYVIPFLLLFVFILLRAGKKPTHAGGVVYKKENGRTLFLLVSSSTGNDKWVLPKGHIEKNETPEFTAVREVLEESGVFARPVCKAAVTVYNKKEKKYVALYFEMEFLQKCGPGLEGRQVAWLEKDDALARLGNGRGAKVLATVKG